MPATTAVHFSWTADLSLAACLRKRGERTTNRAAVTCSECAEQAVVGDAAVKSQAVRQDYLNRSIPKS